MSDKKMVSLEFINMPEGHHREVGPYPFVQITYESVRVGDEGDHFIATFENGFWITEDGEKWTDVTVTAA